MCDVGHTTLYNIVLISVNVILINKINHHFPNFIQRTFYTSTDVVNKFSKLILMATNPTSSELHTHNKLNDKRRNHLSPTSHIP